MRGGRGIGRRSYVGPGFGAGFARGGRGRARWPMGLGRSRWYPRGAGIPYAGWRPYPYGPAPVPYYGVPAYPYPY
jgi:hypothetical protein